MRKLRCNSETEPKIEKLQKVNQINNDLFWHRNEIILYFTAEFATFEVKLLMGRDERELLFVHSVLLDHFLVVLSDRFVFIHNSNIDLIVHISKDQSHLWLKFARVLSIYGELMLLNFC